MFSLSRLAGSSPKSSGRTISASALAIGVSVNGRCRGSPRSTSTDPFTSGTGRSRPVSRPAMFSTRLSARTRASSRRRRSTKPHWASPWVELAQLLGENRAEQLDDPQPLLAHGLAVPGHLQAAVAEPASEVTHLRRSRVGLGVGRLLQGQVDQVVSAQVAEVPHRGLAQDVFELVLPVVSLVRALEQLKIDVHAAPFPAVSARTAGAGGPSDPCP